MKKLRLKFTLLLLLLPVVSWGQKLWSLNDCMIYATEHNPESRRQELSNANARIDYNESILLHLPSVSGSTSWGASFGRSIDPSTNTYNNVSNMSQSYGVSGGLNIFDGLSALNKTRISKFSKLRGDQEYNRINDLIASDAMSAYYQVIFDRRSVQVAAEQLSDNEQLLKQVTTQSSVGLKSVSDVALIEATVASNEYNLTKAQNNYNMSLLKLKDKMFFPYEDNLEIDTIGNSVDIIFSQSRENVDSIYNEALKFIPSALSSQYELKTAKLNLLTSKLRLLPSISMNGGISTGYSQELGVNKTMISEGYRNQLKNRLGESVGFSMSIPLFNGLSRQNNIRRQKNNLRSAEITHDETLRKIRTDIEQAVLDMESADKELSQALKKERADELANNVAMRKYQEGLFSIIDLQKTQTQLLTSRLESASATLRYLAKRKVVDYFKGIPYINL